MQRVQEALAEDWRLGRQQNLLVQHATGELRSREGGGEGAGRASTIISRFGGLSLKHHLSGPLKGELHSVVMCIFVDA